MEIKERIVKGAEQLFLRYGVKNITMDQIAKELGMSKKTIYQLFQDKNELVCAVIKSHLVENEKCIDEIVKNALDPVDEVLKISEFVKNSFQNVSMMVLFEIHKYHPEAYKVFIDHKEECIKGSIVENLKTGIEKGLYRKNINVEIMAKLRLELMELGMNPLVFPPTKFTVQEVQTQFIEHFLHGICTLKGHKLINKYEHITEED